MRPKGYGGDVPHPGDRVGLPRVALWRGEPASARLRRGKQGPFRNVTLLLITAVSEPSSAKALKLLPFCGILRPHEPHRATFARLSPPDARRWLFTSAPAIPTWTDPALRGGLRPRRGGRAGAGRAFQRPAGRRPGEPARRSARPGVRHHAPASAGKPWPRSATIPQIPIVLYIYFNLIHRYGIERFIRDAAAGGRGRLAGARSAAGRRRATTRRLMQKPASATSSWSPPPRPRIGSNSSSKRGTRVHLLRFTRGGDRDAGRRGRYHRRDDGEDPGAHAVADRGGVWHFHTRSRRGRWRDMRRRVVVGSAIVNQIARARIAPRSWSTAGCRSSSRNLGSGR